MELLYIAIASVVLVLLFYGIIFPTFRMKNINKKLSRLSEKHGFKIKRVQGEYYSHIITTPEYNLYISSINVPSNSQLVINSFRTWQLFWGGSSNNPGRSYPNKRYLSEVTPFLNLKLTDPKARKVMIIYCRTEKVLMYINESELIDVSSTDLPHGLKVIQFERLEEEFTNLIN